MADPYVGLFEDWESVRQHFACAVPEPDSVAVAGYDIEGYDGEAMVVYRKGDLWYEVEGSHCSCHGLEGQWTEDKEDGLTTAEAVDHYTKVAKEAWSAARKEWALVAVENIKADRVDVDPEELDVVPSIVSSMRAIAQRIRIVDSTIAGLEADLVEARDEREQAVASYRKCEDEVKRIMSGGGKG